METFIAILALLLGIVGIVGSIAPGLPGPPLSWVGLLLIYIWGGGTDGAGSEMSLTFLLIWLAVTIVITILDYVVPAYFTKLTGGSKAGGWGAIIGLFAGLIVPPVIKSALGAFLGFLFGTGAKLVAAGLMLFYIFVYAF